MAAWAVLIAWPLAALYASAAGAGVPPEDAPGWGVLGRSVALAAGVAAAAVVLGYVPGRLLGTARRAQVGLLLVLLVPLLLPRYLLYYAWDLLLSPTSALGRWMGASRSRARAVKTATSVAVLVLWYWPLAALVLAQGWRRLDADTLARARLDAGAAQRLLRVTLPLLARALVLGFAVCFVLALSEFATFHLAGIETIGRELAVLYQRTESKPAETVARAAWPLAAVAVALAVALWRRAEDWSAQAAVARPEGSPGRWRPAIVIGLMAVSFAAPVALLIAHVRGLEPLGRLWVLHSDQLGWSALTAAVGGVAAVALAGGALLVGGLGRWGRVLSGGMQVTMLAAMFLPGSVVGVAVLRQQARLGVPDGFWVVSAGLAARLAGLALMVLRLLGDEQDRPLSEAAAVDGASAWQRWWRVHLPRNWPLAGGALLLIGMLALTEVPATLLLLPAGLPCLVQWFLNQMHNARDQDVIASCLVLVGVYAALTTAAVALLWLPRRLFRRRIVAPLLVALLAGGLVGCRSSGGGSAEVLRVFGRTGRGRCEFVYPRAIAMDASGDLAVVDRSGRIQRLSREGKYLGGWEMPDTAAGYPTGLTFGPDGNLYVADTHYHRVVVYSPGGRLVRQFGRFGEGGGEFIYPTDVAFSPDGKHLYVSEYGGNDRVSVFTPEGQFLRAFGSPGSGRGQFARPSALAVDPARARLYVADDCNHRIAVYDLSGALQRYIGSPGQAPGQLRHPRDLALTSDGRIVVSEFGNNRIQVFDPDGTSRGVYGGAGRELGKLAYPWAAVVDDRARAYVVDSGNNRIQVWQL